MYQSLRKKEFDIPACAEHVWSWFMELSNHRSVGMAQNPISWTDMEAWARFTQADPAPWEVRAICALDSIFMEWCNLTEDQRKAEKNKKPATADLVVGALRANATPDTRRKKPSTKRTKSDG